MPDPASTFLEHYGVMGMKWGVRKDANRVTKGKKAPKSSANDSEDAKSASAAKSKITSSGTGALSNNELQSLVTRMNLEQQYSKLTSSPKTTGRGKKFVSEVVGNTGKQLAGQYLKKGFETGIKAGIEYQKNKK